MYINDLYLPARVYLHSDTDAPQLTAQNLSLVLKACLVTGYGSKPAAGWTMPYEDAAAGKRVFHPAIYGTQDNYLRIADGNTQAVVQSYTDMSGIDTGDKVLELSQPYMYAKRNFSGAWALIATERSFILWTDSHYNGEPGKIGTLLFYGDSGQSHDGSKCTVLAHSGGSYNDGSFLTPFWSVPYLGDHEHSARVTAQAFVAGQGTGEIAFNSLFARDTNNTIDGEYLAPLYARFAGKLYSIPGIHTNTQNRNNLDTFADEGAEYRILHAHGWTNLQRHLSRIAVRTDKWRY